jgi:tetratricopeptide (TPR) repeat protein
MVLFDIPKTRNVGEFHYSEIGVISWCTRCKKDGSMTRVGFFKDRSIDDVVEILFENRNDNIFEKVPDPFCQRCENKVRNHTKELSQLGYQVKNGDIIKWNVIKVSDVSEEETEIRKFPDVLAEIDLDKKFNLKMNEAQDAWKKGDWMRGDSLSMMAWDLLFPTFRGNSSIRNPESEEELMIINEGILAEKKASFIKSPSNFDLALKLMDEALEKNPFYLTHTTYWKRRGNILDNLRRHTEAITCYQKNIEILKEREQQVPEHLRHIPAAVEDFTRKIYLGQAFLAQYFRSLSFAGREDEASLFFWESQRIKEDVRTRLIKKLPFLER